MLSKTSFFFNTYGKGLALLLALLLGALAPQAHNLAYLIQYFLMVMLFFSFLDIQFDPKSFQKSVWWVLLANVAIAFIGYGIFASYNIMLALAAFMTGIAPSAIASLIIINFVEGYVEYMIAAVLLTNLSSAVIVPLALPSLVGSVIPISIWDVLQSTVFIMFIPFMLAMLARRLPAHLLGAIRIGKRSSLPIWLINLFLISAKSVNFIRNENTSSFQLLFEIALISLGICVINFIIGAWIGGHQYRREASQALGQKNLTFVIWISLTFINPIVAMGPMFYILYHHLYNSWLINRFEKQRIRI